MFTGVVEKKMFVAPHRKPTVVTKYVGSDDEQPIDETMNQDVSNENSENDVDMKSLPKGNRFGC